MKTLLALAALLALTACRSVSYESTSVTQNGATNTVKVKLSSFANKTTLGSWALDANKGTSVLSNYNNDQTAVIIQAFQTGAALGEKAALAKGATNAAQTPFSLPENPTVAATQSTR